VANEYSLFSCAMTDLDSIWLRMFLKWWIAAALRRPQSGFIFCASAITRNVKRLDDLLAAAAFFSRTKQPLELTAEGEGDGYAFRLLEITRIWSTAHTDHAQTRNAFRLGQQHFGYHIFSRSGSPNSVRPGLMSACNYTGNDAGAVSRAR